jgi:hypothetical protein
MYNKKFISNETRCFGGIRPMKIILMPSDTESQ